MTIQSINAYTPSRPSKLDRDVVSRKEYDILEEKVRILQERIAKLEKDFTYFMSKNG